MIYHLAQSTQGFIIHWMKLQGFYTTQVALTSTILRYIVYLTTGLHLSSHIKLQIHFNIKNTKKEKHQDFRIWIHFFCTFLFFHIHELHEMDNIMTNHNLHCCVLWQFGMMLLEISIIYIW